MSLPPLFSTPHSPATKPLFSGDRKHFENDDEHWKSLTPDALVLLPKKDDEMNIMCHFFSGKLPLVCLFSCCIFWRASLPLCMSHAAAVSSSVREVMAEPKRHTPHSPPPPLLAWHLPSQKSVNEPSSSRAGGAASVASGDAGREGNASPRIRKAKGRQVLAMEKRRAVAAQAIARAQEEQQQRWEAEVRVSGRRLGHHHHRL